MRSFVTGGAYGSAEDSSDNLLYAGSLTHERIGNPAKTIKNKQLHEVLEHE